MIICVHRSVQVQLKAPLNLLNTQRLAPAPFDLWVNTFSVFLCIPLCDYVKQWAVLSFILTESLLDGCFQVRAAPPPPKQHPRGQVKRREEVEITLVWRRHPGGGGSCSDSVQTSRDSVPSKRTPKRSQRKLKPPWRRPEATRGSTLKSSHLFTQHLEGFVYCGGILCLSLHYTPF